MWWLWVIVAVIVVSLASWLLLVRMAAKRPGSDNTHIEQRRGQVVGGTHVGGGRSVGPRRDAEVIPDEDPQTPTVPVERGGSSPMDL
jgi:hypothetical protein